MNILHVVAELIGAQIISIAPRTLTGNASAAQRIELRLQLVFLAVQTARRW